MAAPVAALQPIRLASGPAAVTPEQRYWRGFRSQQLIPSPHSNPITHISFPSTTGSTAAPELFSVTSGSRVQIFSSRTRKLIKTINRFGVDDIAHSGEIRRDGRVIVAGGDSGAVQVFDVNSRAILKTWREHKQPVWTTKWNPSDLTTLLTTSDDRTVRLWDLPSSESTMTFTGHQDYVRTGAFMPGQNSNLIATGSYDQTVRIWDSRTADRSVMTFKHAAPIESVLPLLSGTTLLAASDNQITVLDLVAARPLEVLKSHQKTVTSLALATNGTRVASGGLDGHLKVFDTTSWTVVAGSKYPSPILSLSVITSGTQHEDRHLAVGMQSGLLSLKTRLSGEQKVQKREKDKEMQALMDGKIEEFDKKNKKKQLTQGLAKRLRGIEYQGHGADIIIEGNERRKRKNLPQWDQALRKVQYGKALDLALAEEPQNPITVLTILTALHQRSALQAALRGRDETTLQPIMKWLIKHLSDPRHIVLTSYVSKLLLDLYAENVGQSSQIDKLVMRLHERVRALVDRSQDAQSTMGMLDMIMLGS
jgi:U3 small nucleolar RNA-associated protein 15